MKYYVTSDTHFNHDMLIERGYREVGFGCVILDAIQKISGDVLLHLGDFAIGDDEYYHEQFMLASKNFKKKILVRGNHDNKSYSWYYSHGWDFVCETMRLRVFGKEILFSHMPIIAENVETPPYLKVDMNLHGHLHGGGKYSHRAIEGYDAGFHYDCGVDANNFAPISLEDIINRRIYDNE